VKGLTNAAGAGMHRRWSITYRIAVGPQQGRKVFTLQTLPDESDSLSSSTVGETAGFSLHAGVATNPCASRHRDILTNGPNG